MKQSSHQQQSIYTALFTSENTTITQEYYSYLEINEDALILNENVFTLITMSLVCALTRIKNTKRKTT